MPIVNPRATNQIKIEKRCVYSGNNVELLNNPISPNKVGKEKRNKEHMGKVEKDQQDGRFKPNHTNNFIKCQYAKHSA